MIDTDSAMTTAEAAPTGISVPEGVGLEVVDKEQLIAEANQFFTEKTADRRPYELAWFLNAAAVRTASDARIHPYTSQLEPLMKEPSHRARYPINRVRVKYLAKIAKYTNSRPRPIVIAASDDREDIYDAALSEQALHYIWRKIDLEAKYERVTAWSEITGKSFLGLRWDPTKKARIIDPATGEPAEVTAGDVEVNVVPAFEILPDDTGLETLGEQKRLMHVKLQLVTDVEQRYDQPRGTVSGDASADDLFQFQKQIAGLGARYNTTATLQTDHSTQGDNRKKRDYVIVKQFFKAPSAEHPKGCYMVIAGGKMLKYVDSLPYEFNEFSNPYPYEEFASSISPGQFWPTTMVEQLRPLNEQLNEIRNKIIEHLRMSMHGKLMVPRHAKIAENAWNSEAGEKVYFSAPPGSVLPFVVHPLPLAQETWRTLDTITREFDEISNISAATTGLSNDSESGYQAQVLQEANDAVFGPDKNRMERSLAATLTKVRHLMHLGYTEERLIAATGKGFRASIFTFSQANIDPAAEIQVQIGSALPDGKAARVNAILEFKAAGLFGDAENPRVRRGILDLVDLGGIEKEVDADYQDVERARLENLKVSNGQRIEAPLPWNKHLVHIAFHEEQLNSTEFDSWKPEWKSELIFHYALHLRVVDPVKGLEVVQMFANDPKIGPLLPEFQQIVAIAQAQMNPMAPGGAPAPSGANPNQPPPFGGGSSQGAAPFGGGAPAQPQAA